MKLIDADKLREEWVSRLHIINPDSYFAVEQEITDDCIAGFIQSIDEQPKIDARPVTHGHWEGEGCTCSVCGESLVSIMDADSYFAIGFEPPSFCPFCGAEM